jgi:hypothetical protein
MNDFLILIGVHVLFGFSVCIVYTIFEESV